MQPSVLIGLSPSKAESGFTGGGVALMEFEMFLPATFGVGAG